MANPEHLEILKRGVQEWNVWREQNPLILPDLSGALLKGMKLSQQHEQSNHVYLVQGVNLNRANLAKANLQGMELFGADLTGSDLSAANLINSVLIEVDFSYATLKDTNFTGANIIGATFAQNDLNQARGLETVYHMGPSNISIDTLYLSSGNIPDLFLHGCGVPDDFIVFMPSHFGIQQAIQFFSCFISYSTKDEEFARRLYSRMRDEKLRVWFAPEDIKGGQKLQEQIYRAIQLHDRLLLVLSENSMQSDWVITEIHRARKIETEENRRKLFPITIVDFDKVKTWKCPDADSGKDLAKEVREYFIPDFSNWKDHDSFEKAFNRLLRDMKAEEK